MFPDYQFRHSSFEVRFTHLIVPLHLFPHSPDPIASVVVVVVVVPEIRPIDRRPEYRYRSNMHQILRDSPRIFLHGCQTTVHHVLRTNCTEVERFNEYNWRFFLPAGLSYYSLCGFTFSSSLRVPGNFVIRREKGLNA